jgi:hypothetical protein
VGIALDSPVSYFWGEFSPATFSSNEHHPQFCFPNAGQYCALNFGSGPLLKNRGIPLFIRCKIEPMTGSSPVNPLTGQHQLIIILFSLNYFELTLNYHCSALSAGILYFILLCVAFNRGAFFTLAKHYDNVIPP